LPIEVVREGIKEKLYLEGQLRVNQHNARDSYVTVEGNSRL